MTDIATQLRNLMIMDEVGSDNPLGRIAADEIERLRKIEAAAKTLIQEYAKELYSSTFGPELTLEQLIDSHRTMRALRLEYNESWEKARKDGYEAGINQGLEAINNEYIKVQDLKSMTLDQIAKIIYGLD